MLYGFCFCGLEFLLAEPLCLQLYDSHDAGTYLRLYALLIPMLYCDAVTDAMTKGLGQQNACVRYNILTSAMDVALLFILLPTYGMDGYFFSFLVTHVINFALSVRRLLKLTGRLIAPAIPVLALAATGGAIYFASLVTQPAFRACAYVLLLGSLLPLLRVVSSEDVSWIRGLVYKK
jgi:O-antigen/teichoic acid export membrane protein